MYRVFKRLIDIIFSSVALILLLPLLLLIALMIKIDSKGRALFAQPRHGKDEKLFMCYKFRTMRSTVVVFDVNNVVITNTNTNVTRVGKLLRKFKLDELPQLYNVLRGDMSIIGHRPFMTTYMPNYQQWEKRKFIVRPGLTGYNQVNGNGHLSTPERSYYDVLYTEKIGLWTDISIFFKTFLVIILGEKRFLHHVSQDKIQQMSQRYSDEQDTNT